MNHVVVALPEPLAPKGKTTVEIEYEGPLLGYSETGMLYVKDKIDPEFTILRMDAYAYPVQGAPSRAMNRRSPLYKYTYTARIEVPKELVVANGGHLDGVESAGDRATYTFSSIKPSWRMDFAIAKYGELSSGPIRIFHLPGDKAGAESVAQAA
ncbi:MAG TPA: peptidase M1, partial [Thermoanaerobaculia bacterium]|nr:peptidase M1 [Thermoanaerobaculia bacterium]